MIVRMCDICNEVDSPMTDIYVYSLRNIANRDYVKDIAEEVFSMEFFGMEIQDVCEKCLEKIKDEGYEVVIAGEYFYIK